MLVVFVCCDLDLRSLHILDDDVWFCYFDLDLHLERLLLHRAAQRDQLGQHRLFACDQESIDLFRQFTRLLEEFRFIQRKQFMVAHQPLPIDHHIRYISGFGSKDQLGVGIQRIPFEARRVVQGGGVHQDQVGAFARFQRSGQMSDVKRLRSHAGSHHEGGCSGEDGRVVGGSLGDERGEADFFEHIEVIVRGGSIRADADVQSVFEHLCHRREP